MNKSRRDFLKKLPLAMSIPFTLGGFNVRAIDQSLLGKLGALSTNDKVLVILQMHGGNDGLNCCIPANGDLYDRYYNLRPNIAIPAKNSSRKFVQLDSTLPPEAQIGLHPDMLAMKTLYDQGRMTIVQGVSYQDNNGSHFRGRDIWFMGGSAGDQLHSGWLGRYLKTEYAPLKYPEDFPTASMPDPLAIEVGNDVSLIFHQEQSITTAINLHNIPAFADLVEDLEGFEEMEGTDPRGIPSEFLSGSPYYKELDWILNLEDKSKDYASILLEEYNRGLTKPKATYPERYPFSAPQGSIGNPLSGQLQMVANLLAGGCKTKVFMVRIGGFDTHADQVEALNPTMGGHAALMYHVSTAMKAFQEDLRAKGLEDKVLTITTSEFGRRAKSNGSYGTDHGTAGPLFIFGKGVKPGVLGNALELTNNGQGDNLEMQFDYRNVYANIVIDWLGVSKTTDIARLNEIFPDGTAPEDTSKGLMTTGTSDGVTFEELPIATQNITSNESFIGDRFALEECYPNPAKGKTTVHFKINSAYHVDVVLFDNSGKKALTMVDGFFEPGTHKVEVDLTGMQAGTYIYELKTGFYKEAKKLIIVK
ncbi:MAG TPA: DUF1501 domain-containing protein [Ohtaekwangia sp.]